ncbi:MAG TPA: hypothetical protein VFU87_05905 [Sphingomicrobium sp.]|nr:hypothetical protein [Sphingomicrobium sp.]
MSSSVAEPGRENLSETYETIEKAVMETERGRWFLAEHARRQRSADTSGILESLKRLESLLVPSASSPIRPPDDALDYMQSAARELLSRSDALRRIADRLENQEIQAALAGEADAVRLVALNHDLFRHRFATLGKPAAPTADQLKYFADDEEEFEDSAPRPAPVLRTVPPVQLVTEAPPAKNRIVIIRHAAGEEPVIPLQNELAAAG